MKIVGSDYDGTLSYGGITERKLRAIEKWRKAGNKFGLVSGRGKEFREQLQNMAPDLTLDFFAVCNGAYIMDENGKPMYDVRCKEVALLPFVKDLFAFGGAFVQVHGERYLCVVEKATDVPKNFPKDILCLLAELPQIEEFNQVSVRMNTMEETTTAVEKIRKKYGKWLNPLQNGMNIDIVPVGVDKAEGMRRVMEFFGCKEEDVIAVGDNVNDMDMLRAFRSYAMANGVAAVKELADGIVEDVADLLEREL